MHLQKDALGRFEHVWAVIRAMCINQSCRADVAVKTCVTIVLHYPEYYGLIDVDHLSPELCWLLTSPFSFMFGDFGVGRSEDVSNVIDSINIGVDIHL